MNVKKIFLVGALLGLLLFGWPDLANAASGWYEQGTLGGCYYIATAEELRELAALVNGDGGDDFSGKAVYLTADIDLGGTDWEPVGRLVIIRRARDDEKSRSFAGVFDGQNHRITGLSIDSEENYQGLFGCVKNAEIRNLTVVGKVRTTGDYAAGIVAAAYGDGLVIKNCTSEVALSGGRYAAGILAQTSANRNLITGCTNLGNINSADGVGGICYDMSREVVIRDCCNSGKLEKLPGDGTAGGLAGIIAADGWDMTLQNCCNKGELYGPDAKWVGGLVGRGHMSHSLTITGCWNEADILGDSGVGGLVGTLPLPQNLKPGCISDCYSLGRVSGNSWVGGLAGTEGCELWNCYFAGTVNVPEAGATYGLFGRSYIHRNCYALTDSLLIAGEPADMGKYATVVSEAQLASGELAWLLDEGNTENRRYNWTMLADRPQPTIDFAGAIYRINTSEAVSNGRIETQIQYAKPGQQITVNVVADPGYICRLITAEDSFGRIFASAGGAAQLIFEMPDDDVLLTTEFVEASVGFGPSIGVEENIVGDAENDYMVSVAFYADKPEKRLSETRTLTLGEYLTEPPQLADFADLRKLYTFVGWSRWKRDGEPWDFTASPVTEDMEFYALWQEEDRFEQGKSAAGAVVLQSLEDLRALAENVSLGKSYSDCYFELGADMVLPEDWPGIGSQNVPFAGVFAGGGHVVNMENCRTGLFNYCSKKSYIRDLQITGSITADEHILGGLESFGAVACETDGVVYGCKVKLDMRLEPEAEIAVAGLLVGRGGTLQHCESLVGSSLTGMAANKCGGLVGIGDALDCVSYANVDVSCQFAGGVSGNPKIIENCVNYGDVQNQTGAAGGIAGGVVNGVNSQVYGAHNYGTIVGQNISAGIVAAYAIDKQNNYGTKLTVTDCTNQGVVTAMAGSAAGIVGSSSLSPKPGLGIAILGCYNNAAINGTEYVGGIAGMFDSLYGGMGAEGRDLVNVIDCHNTGDITASGDYVGGILGANTYYGALTLSDSDNTGEVQGVNFVGGVAGYVDHSHDNVVERVRSSGNVVASGSYVGGLLGYGNLKDSVWSGQYIKVAADSRFVNELVGDAHSIIFNSSVSNGLKNMTYDMENEDLTELFEETINKALKSNSSVVVEDVERLAEPEEDAETVRYVRPVVNIQEDKETSRNTFEDTTKTATVFEVVRNTVTENPFVSVVILGAIFGVIGLSSWRRYVKNRNE